MLKKRRRKDVSERTREAGGFPRPFLKWTLASHNPLLSSFLIPFLINKTSNRVKL
jgi:hypothetical protein